jgi:hypothetical protein
MPLTASSSCSGCWWCSVAGRHCFDSAGLAPAASVWRCQHRHCHASGPPCGPQQHHLHPQWVQLHCSECHSHSTWLCGRAHFQVAQDGAIWLHSLSHHDTSSLMLLSGFSCCCVTWWSAACARCMCGPRGPSPQQVWEPHQVKIKI